VKQHGTKRAVYLYFTILLTGALLTIMATGQALLNSFVNHTTARFNRILSFKNANKGQTANGFHTHSKFDGGEF